MADIKLSEAAMNIIPVAISDEAGVARLREEAHGTLLSASYPGRYQKPVKSASRATRKIDLPDAWNGETKETTKTEEKVEKKPKVFSKPLL